MKCALFPSAVVIVVAACTADAPVPSSDAEPWISERGFAAAGARFVAEPDGRRQRLRVGEIPIWGLAGKVVDGRVRAPDVRFEGPSKIDVRPGVRAQVAASAAQAALAAAGELDARVEASDLVLLPREERRPVAATAENAVDYERVIVDLRLIYRLRLSAGDGEGREWLAEVDARTGEVLDLAPLGADVTPRCKATGYGKYVGQTTFFTPFDGYSCILQDGYGNRYTAHDGTSIEPYESDDTLFGDGNFYDPSGRSTLSANGETAAVDALVATDLTWRMFSAVLGRLGPDGHGRALEIRLHWMSGQSSTYVPALTNPRLELGYIDDSSVSWLIPAATTDIVAHELGHDFFMTEVFAEPWNASMARSELRAMDEATADIVGMLTEMYRDLGARPVSSLDFMPLLQRYTDMGEETGHVARNILDTSWYEWFDGIGGIEPHAAAGPIERMFVLLSYGCLPVVNGLPMAPQMCRRLPRGFPGIGAKSAFELWAATVVAMPEGANFVQARQLMLDAATAADGDFGGPKTKAVADAFAAVNVGTPADRTPPAITGFTCTQVLTGVACRADISDVDSPTGFARPPELVLDGIVRRYVLPGWHVDFLIPKSDLVDGVHTVTLQAWDLWNNANFQVVTVSVDLQPPTVSVTVTGAPKHPTLHLTASDPSGVGGAELRDGTKLLGMTGPPSLDLSLDTTSWTDGDHDISILVFDTLLNSTTLHQIIRVDNSPPVLTMTVGAGPPPFSVNAIVDDASPVTAVFKLDGAVIGTVPEPIYFVRYSPQDAAAHTLSVEVTDTFGNRSSTAIPAPRDLTPPDVTFSASQTGVVVTIVTGVADTCGIVNPWTIAVDGVVVAQPTTPTYVLVMGSSLSVGVHAFQAVASDRCGNVRSFVATFTKANNVPPVITGITRDDSSPKKPKFTVQCVDTDGVDHVEMRKNGVVLQSDNTLPYEFVVDTSTWPDGDSTVLFQCTDIFGASSDPVSRTVTADNTGPGFAFNVLGAGHTYKVSADGVGDAHGIQSVHLAGGLTYPVFDVVVTALPYQFVWAVPSNTDFKTTFPFWVTATDSWGNQHGEFYWCYVDTYSTTPTYLSCTRDNDGGAPSE